MNGLKANQFLRKKTYTLEIIKFTIIELHRYLTGVNAYTCVWSMKRCRYTNAAISKYLFEVPELELVYQNKDEMSMICYLYIIYEWTINYPLLEFHSTI